MGYTHGKKWTESDIIDSVQEIIDKYNMDTFPTHSEINRYTNNKSLSCAISKHGGTKYFSELMNMKIKPCESKFGEKYELKTIKLIKTKNNLDSEKMKVGYPYDISTNKNIKIDVKVSRLCTNNNGCKYYSFNLEKGFPTCDIYILYCVNDDDEILKTYIVPSCFVFGQNQIGIGANRSKYDKYIDKWEYIIEYDNFYKKLQGEN